MAYYMRTQRSMDVRSRLGRTDAPQALQGAHIVTARGDIPFLATPYAWSGSMVDGGIPFRQLSYFDCYLYTLPSLGTPVVWSPRPQRP
jgi:hypothetical protein